MGLCSVGQCPCPQRFFFLAVRQGEHGRERYGFIIYKWDGGQFVGEGSLLASFRPIAEKSHLVYSARLASGHIDSQSVGGHVEVCGFRQSVLQCVGRLQCVSLHPLLSVPSAEVGFCGIFDVVALLCPIHSTFDDLAVGVPLQLHIFGLAIVFSAGETTPEWC